MKSVTSLSLDLSAPNIAAVAYAVQNDRSARHIVAQLRDGSSPWTPPYGAAAIIRYLKPDGTGGFYDTDDNNNSAVTITGSVADLTLVEQTLTVPGDVYMQLNFYATDGTRLTTFAWILRVQPSVLADAAIVSSDYFNALTEKITEGAAVAAQLTFPVPVENGGTGATTAAGARENIGLGNVTNERQYSAQNPPPYPVTSVNGQTGAVSIPTAESGTNYCKMPDGTLMCWGLLSELSPRNLTGTESGTLYYHEYTADVTFPIAFVNTPSISVTTLTGRECSISWVVANTTTLSSFDTLSGQQTIESTRKLRVSWIAIGRWK